MNAKQHADNVQTILLLQRLARQRKAYTGTLDGWGGNETRKGLLQLLPDLEDAPMVLPDPTFIAPPAGELLDARTERNLATMLPEVQSVARQFIRECLRKGYNTKIISGTRTYEEQDRLYRQANDGKDNDGDGRIDEADERVTKAPAGYSNHNFGLAFDVGIFEGKKYLTGGNLYVEISKLGKALGLEWGGDWTSFQDRPHYQLRPAWAAKMRETDMLAELRKRKAVGVSFFADKKTPPKTLRDL